MSGSYNSSLYGDDVINVYVDHAGSYPTGSGIIWSQNVNIARGAVCGFCHSLFLLSFFGYCLRCGAPGGKALKHLGISIADWMDANPSHMEYIRNLERSKTR